MYLYYSSGGPNSQNQGVGYVPSGGPGWGCGWGIPLSRLFWLPGDHLFSTCGSFLESLQPGCVTSDWGPPAPLLWTLLIVLVPPGNAELISPFEVLTCDTPAGAPFAR